MTGEIGAFLGGNFPFVGLEDLVWEGEVCKVLFKLEAFFCSKECFSLEWVATAG